MSTGVRLLAAGLKGAGRDCAGGVPARAAVQRHARRPGANLFVVLADNSQSMALRDRGQQRRRGEELESLAAKRAGWLARIGQDFDLRQYAFDTQLRPLPGFETLSFDGGASNLAASLERVVRRYQGRPLAGVLLLTDGNATDADAVEKLLGRGGGTRARPAAVQTPRRDRDRFIRGAFTCRRCTRSSSGRTTRPTTSTWRTSR